MKVERMVTYRLFIPSPAGYFMADMANYHQEHYNLALSLPTPPSAAAETPSHFLLRHRMPLL